MRVIWSAVIGLAALAMATAAEARMGVWEFDVATNEASVQFRGGRVIVSCKAGGGQKVVVRTSRFLGMGEAPVRTLQTRVDRAEAREFSWSHREREAELNNPAAVTPLLDEFATGARLYLSVHSINDKVSHYEARLFGSRDAITKVRQACP